MFDNITKSFQNLFAKLGKERVFTESNLSSAVKEVRMALLEADVNYSVASRFIKKVKEKALGETVIKAVSPKDQFIKIVHDELKLLMGESESSLEFASKPSVYMLCGLQGAGKTTHAAKLAYYLKSKHHKKVMLAACDLQRPAAIEQLKKLGLQAGADVYHDPDQKKPVSVAKAAYECAKNEKYDVLIIDTAGRLHVDENLMSELLEIKKIVNPHEVLFVANATTGQDAVKTAAEFDGKVSITGTILTMLDGDARAGAAISIREVTNRPLKFEGTGEKLEDLQIFNPHSMADRILGMGDVINLVKKAEEHISEEERQKMEKKLKKASFTYNDYLKQMSMIQKMGSMKSLLKMIPGMSGIGNLDLPQKELKKVESIILSMTPDEREERVEISHSRRRRIASGAGLKVDDVNKLVKGFKQIKQLLKSMKGKGFMPNMNQLKNQMRGQLWR
ncbi:MAG TPA: signal recognition particle protein [Chlamydiales bacterium]|nr:signal recognition particle protein [Chlamydiales bacterium]